MVGCLAKLFFLMSNNNLDESNPTSIHVIGLEIIAITAVFGLLSWTAPPDVNEAHYLCKAKHFWDSTFCANDLFLQSSNAHWLFFVSFGWLTNIFSLDIAAFFGRVICWLILAIGWRHLTAGILKNSWLAIGSAGLFVVINRLGNLAGEWVVGGVESKCVAYGLVFFVIGDVINRIRLRTFLLLGLAVAFHGLVGLWSTFVIVLALGFTSRIRINFVTTTGSILYVLLAAIGIIPALLMNRTASPEEMLAACHIQVFERLSHHLYLFDFSFARTASFIATSACWFIIAVETWFDQRTKKVHLMAIFALAVSVIGAILSIGENATLLRYYWFRIADVLIPLATSIGLIQFLEKRWSIKPKLIAWSLIGVSALAIGWHAFKQFQEPRPRADQQSLPTYESPKQTTEAHQNWKKVCRWIKDNTPEDAIFITPLEQQTFKWNAHRAEVVCWKDAPQDALGLLEWQKRIDWISSFSGTSYGALYPIDEEIRDFASKYNAIYLLVSQRAYELRILNNDPVSFERVYPEKAETRSTYVVLRINHEPDLP